MSTEAWAFSAVTFLVGVAIGALGTIAAFRSQLAVLAHQVDQVPKLDAKVDELVKDLNGLGEKMRLELTRLRDAIAPLSPRSGRHSRESDQEDAA